MASFGSTIQTFIPQVKIIYILFFLFSALNLLMSDSAEAHFKLADTKCLYKSIKRAKAVEKARRRHKTKARAKAEEGSI